MEETVSVGLNLGVILCRLFFGGADCSQPPPSVVPVTVMPPTAECTVEPPWYELVLEADAAALDQGDAATIEARLRRPDICRLSVGAQPDGSVRLGIATADNPLELLAPVLVPGELTFHRVVDDLAPGAPLTQEQMGLQSVDGDQVYVVEVEPLLGGRAVASAEATLTPYGEWAITIRFTDKGAERFGEITAQMLGRQLAMVLDRRVLSAPTIQEAILGGSAMISGGFDEAQAREMAALLDSAPLPAGVHVVSITAP